MLRWRNTADRAAIMLVAALGVAGVVPLAAQQATGSGPAAGASATQAVAPSAPLPGPRVQAEYRSFQPSVADSSASGRASSMEGSHSIVISTLSLILIVIIIVLLI